MTNPRWRRLVALVLLLPAVLAVGEGLHHHETLAALLSPGTRAGTPQAVSSHDPLSRATHWHAAVLVHEDACAACSIHRAFGTTSGCEFAAPLGATLSIRADPASICVSLICLALGSRAPPSLL